MHIIIQPRRLSHKMENRQTHIEASAEVTNALNKVEAVLNNLCYTVYENMIPSLEKLSDAIISYRNATLNENLVNIDKLAADSIAVMDSVLAVEQSYLCAMVNYQNIQDAYIDVYEKLDADDANRVVIIKGRYETFKSQMNKFITISDRLIFIKNLYGEAY